MILLRFVRSAADFHLRRVRLRRQIRQSGFGRARRRQSGVGRSRRKPTSAVERRFNRDVKKQFLRRLFDALKWIIL
jgi:hypothetical protein